MFSTTAVNRDVRNGGHAERFSAASRVQIPNFLEPEVAARWTTVVKSPLPWVLQFREAGRATQVTEVEYLSLPAPQREDLLARIHALAREDFQFMYCGCSLSPANLARLESGHGLRVLASHLFSLEFMERMRRVVGDPEICGITASVTRYDSGHFLLPHDDSEGTDDRRAAFVLNLSEDWWPDWGGLLQFIDDDRNVSQSFSPHNNSLSLFKVPQMHAVSYVTPHAARPRYAVAGWLIA